MTDTATTETLTITARVLANAMLQLDKLPARPVGVNTPNRKLYVRAASVAAARLAIGRTVHALIVSAEAAGRPVEYTALTCGVKVRTGELVDEMVDIDISYEADHQRGVIRVNAR